MSWDNLSLQLPGGLSSWPPRNSAEYQARGEGLARTAVEKKWVVLAVLVLTLAIGAGIAVATVTSTVLSDTETARLRIVRSEFVPSADQPRFTSGWHTHPGPVIVQVQEGFLKITQATCAPNYIGAGETYVETPELPIVATANGPVKWTTSMILPPGTLVATPAANPCN